MLQTPIKRLEIIQKNEQIELKLLIQKKIKSNKANE